MARVHRAEMKRRSSHELFGLGSFGLRGMLKEHHFRIVAWQDFSDWGLPRSNESCVSTVAAAVQAAGLVRK